MHSRPIRVRSRPDRSKTVTRRLGWRFLKAGDVIVACVKCMGLKPGEKLERLATLRVVDVRLEMLGILNDYGYQHYGKQECIKEGFPEMQPDDFVLMFCHHMNVNPTMEVTRIEFEYLE